MVRMTRLGKSEDILKQLIQKEGYSIFEDMDPRHFYHAYGENIRIADKSYGLLTGWSHHFHYCFKEVRGACIIAGLGLEGKIEFYVVMEKPKDIRHGLDEIMRLHSIYQMPVAIDYVDDWELPFYLKQEEYVIDYGFNPDLSDYVYELKKYCLLTGKKNRHKRQKINYVKKNYSNIRYIEYQTCLKQDVMKVMEQWCGGYSCEKCIFGCEKVTLERLLEKYNDKYFKCGLLYLDKEPVSFAFLEQINNRELICLIQKSIEPMRGVTYYLSRLLCRINSNATYFNLGEDMGLPGLKEDKTGYHPEFMLKKYRLYVYMKQKKGG